MATSKKKNANDLCNFETWQLFLFKVRYAEQVCLCSTGIYFTCEKFLCSGFFLWSALWNWPFLSTQDFEVAWDATFTQVPASKYKGGKKYFSCKRSTSILFNTITTGYVINISIKHKVKLSSVNILDQTYQSLHQPLLPITHTDKRKKKKKKLSHLCVSLRGQINLKTLVQLPHWC